MVYFYNFARSQWLNDFGPIISIQLFKLKYDAFVKLSQCFEFCSIPKIIRTNGNAVGVLPTDLVAFSTALLEVVLFLVGPLHFVSSFLEIHWLL